ncbi:hypothetical protein EIN_370150 [Entamoeba invadens IP1]|uniref:Uncharacterized protein n=1 Tax=Entamoeba invadens IP1 TaxID=370355 RepID=A0A0A1UC26_ENTIV|nr:hypothetical protein EIN_370150 [Entamoeba invadens IP1]ELP92673.1 hypothetical protein EIN_370150 [Entamoeba invadens IP1]|eukprot:XP_004259444.1 hypothetical protein EIN_370150 [Entamoeba invadens IP1]
MNAEGLESDNNIRAITEEINGLIDQVGTNVDEIQTMEIYRTVQKALRELVTTTDVTQLLKNLVFTYNKRHLSPQTFPIAVTEVFETVKVSLVNVNTYIGACKMLLSLLLIAPEKEAIVELVKDVTKYFCEELSRLCEINEVKKPIFLFLLKIVKKLILHFKSPTLITSKDFLITLNIVATKLILLQNCEIESKELDRTIELSIQNEQVVSDMPTSLPFPVNFKYVLFSTLKPIERLTSTLILLTQSVVMTQQIYEEMYCNTLEHLVELMKSFSKLISLLDLFLTGNRLVQLFSSRILYVVLSLVPVLQRKCIVDTLQNDISVLLALLLNDPANDEILNEVYIKYLGALPGNDNLVRFLCSRREIGFFIREVGNFDMQSIGNVVTPQTLQFLPKEALVSISDAIRAKMPSLTASRVLSVIMRSLPSYTQTAVERGVGDTIEYAPLLVCLNKECCQTIIRGFQCDGLEHCFWLAFFFKYATVGEGEEVKEVGEGLKEQFIAFLRAEATGEVVPLVSKVVVVNISSIQVIEDIEKMMLNARELVLKNGDASDVWNKFITKVVGWKI